MARADFITGILLFLLGVYMLVEGMGMPGAGGYIEAGGEPGRVPMLLGVVIALMALVLLIRSIRAGGHRLVPGVEGSKREPGRWLRGFLAAAWCTCYALVMLGSEVGGWRMSYESATAVFLVVFVVGFEWQNAEALGAQRWQWLVGRFPSVGRQLQSRFGFVKGPVGAYLWLFFTASLQAGAVTLIVAWLFERKFYVQLP